MELETMEGVDMFREIDLFLSLACQPKPQSLPTCALASSESYY